DVIEQFIVAAHRKYRLAEIRYDRYMAAQMIQHFVKMQMRCVEATFKGAPAEEMAAHLIEAFRGRVIELYRDEQLLPYLRRLIILRGKNNYRLDAPRTSAGHADCSTSLALACLAARHGQNQYTLDVYVGGGKDMTPDEISEGVKKNLGQSFW